MTKDQQLVNLIMSRIQIVKSEEIELRDRTFIPVLINNGFDIFVINKQALDILMIYTYHKDKEKYAKHTPPFLGQYLGEPVIYDYNLDKIDKAYMVKHNLATSNKIIAEIIQEFNSESGVADG